MTSCHIDLVHLNWSRRISCTRRNPLKEQSKVMWY